MCQDRRFKIFSHQVQPKIVCLRKAPAVHRYFLATIQHYHTHSHQPESRVGVDTDMWPPNEMPKMTTIHQVGVCSHTFCIYLNYMR